MTTKTLLAIQDYLKANVNGVHPTHFVFNPLGKHGPYEERGLTPKAVDCLVRLMAKKEAKIIRA